MEPHIHNEENTLSLSNLHIKDDTMIHLKENQNSSSSSSTSSSSFDQDFLGFFSEEWSRDNNNNNNTSPENIIFCGKLLSSKQSIATGDDDRKIQPINPQFRSNSDSFRYMRFKTGSSTPRSNSVPNRSSTSSSSSPCKSRWKVFLFGFGSGKFQAKMDMSDIKIRQLRRQSDHRTVVDGEEMERRSGKKGWWRLVDVLGCSGGYERDTMVVV
ncbi:hypothetical protein OSB04_026449 [Centaurea solstitialis]|uniref:Uncharacterized protein n=1 Tax=Centaurea solstitialis TaxID=347529 RepID=A0AA38SJD8_9ASTR|nr:hypothetical protein OSB04_026449 [Centaurea solstitialis]